MTDKNLQLRSDIDRMMASGESVTSISRRLGISRQRVYQIAREQGYRFTSNWTKISRSPGSQNN